MGMKKTCFLFGHSDTPEGILPLLEQVVSICCREHGIQSFLVGQYGNFDRWAGLAVKTVKQQHPSISLRLLLAYHPAERPAELPSGYDGTIYPDGQEFVPRRYAIVRANRHMIQTSDAVICYAKYAGNASKMFDLALRQKRTRNIPVYNIADMI